MPEMKELHTKRLRIEPLVEAHAVALFPGLQNQALYEFVGTQAPASVEALVDRYRRLAARKSPDGSEAWLNWALWSLSLDRHVGWIQATVHHDRTAYIAYVLFRGDWGSGYAREAVTALIDHLRCDWSVAYVRATVDTRNRRSIALLEALGFARGEVRVGAEEIRGVMEDEVEYGVVVG